MPGISRSGATVAAGPLNGPSHEDSARFAFLLAIPVLAAAEVLKLPELAELGPPLPWSSTAGVVVLEPAFRLVHEPLSVKFWPPAMMGWETHVSARFPPMFDRGSCSARSVGPARPNRLWMRQKSSRVAVIDAAYARSVRTTRTETVT